MSDFAKDTNVPTNDCISRQVAIDCVKASPINGWAKEDLIQALETTPSAQPEIIRCKDCGWSDKKGCALYCSAWNRYTAWNGWCHQGRERREDGVDS